MLYNQALLALDYLEGHHATGRTDWADQSRSILRSAIRDFALPSGVFTSALDADSRCADGQIEEGCFYTWTPEELVDVLGPTDGALAAMAFGVRTPGNVDGRSVLYVATTPEAAATALGISTEDLDGRWASIVDRLFQARALRPPPHRDTKVLAAWNGLLISALARTGAALGDPTLVDAARAAADTLLRTHFTHGQLHRTAADGGTPLPAMLEDHAFLIAGLIDLFEATGDGRWLTAALQLDQEVERRFADPEHGGWYRSPADSGAPIVREKSDHDGALPAGSSVHALNQLRLSTLTTRPVHRARATAALASVGTPLAVQPTAMTEMLLAVDWAVSEARSLAIILPPGAAPDAAEPLRTAARLSGNPHVVQVIVAQGPAQDALVPLVPWLEGKTAQDHLPTAYLCSDGLCEAPTTDPDVLLGQMRRGAANK